MAAARAQQQIALCAEKAVNSDQVVVVSAAKSKATNALHTFYKKKFREKFTVHYVTYPEDSVMPSQII